jgi:large subunit ribosomal protein L6
MSRIGRAPIPLPAGVEIKVSDDNTVTVKGPKGTLERQICPEIGINVEGGAVHVTRPSDAPRHRSLHGLSRSLLNSMVVGVSEGFRKELEISGVGFRAVKEGKKTGAK